jgi:hypothetical protein
MRWWCPVSEGATRVSAPKVRRGRSRAAAYAKLSDNDEEDLRWYLAHGGLGLFQFSSFGAQLARASLYSHGTVPCERCGGDRQAHKNGTGFISSKASKRPPSDEERMMLEWMNIHMPDMPPLADQVCPDCDGLGFTTKRTSHNTHATGPVTARPTRETRDESGVSVSEANLARLGRISTRLDVLRKVDWEACAALELYFAPDGGHLGVVWPLTPAGKKLLKKNPRKLPPQQLLINIREEQRLKCEPNVSKLFIAADEQAEELVARACDLWRRRGVPATRGGSLEETLDRVQRLLAAEREALNELKERLNDADNEAADGL